MSALASDRGEEEQLYIFFLRKISLLTSSEILCCMIWAIVSKRDQTCQKMFLSTKFIVRSLSVHSVHFFDFPPVQVSCLTGLTHYSECSCQVNLLFIPLRHKITLEKEEWVVLLLLLSKPALWCWWSNKGCYGPELSIQAARNSIRYFPVAWHFLCWIVPSSIICLLLFAERFTSPSLSLEWAQILWASARGHLMLSL